MRPLRLLQRVHEHLRRPRRLLAAAALAVALVVAVEGATGPAAVVAAPTVSPRGAATFATSPADTFESPGETDRVSFDTDGSQLSTASGTAGVSADGRYVVFRTALMTPSGVDVGRILLRDRVAGTTTEVARGSQVAGIAVVTAAVSAPAISGDGRWVAFVIGNPDPAANVRAVDLWDRTTGQITQPLNQVDGWTDEPALSGNGRYLAFRTHVPLDPTDTNGFDDVYVIDRTNGTFDRVSTGLGGKGGYRGDSGQPSISSDGRWVAFTSSALGLVGQSVPGGQTTEVYLRDRTSKSTGLVSVRPDGSAGTGSSNSPSVSPSGPAVAFASFASDLVASDANGLEDVFLWSARTNAVTMVSVSTEGVQGNGASAQPSISGDGRVVAFASLASNLVPNDTNGGGGLNAREGRADVFVRDLARHRTARISIGPGPVQANNSSLLPATDGDGGVIAFESMASNLVANDTNGVRDVFVRVRPAGIGIAPNPTDFGIIGGGGPPPAPKKVTISSTGLIPLSITAISIGGAGASSFSIVADGCTGKRIAPGSSCQVVVGVSIASAGQQTARLQVADNAPAAPHSAKLTALALGAAGAPKITISPTVGPTGSVVVVTGSGFAAGQPVTLAWSVGITPTPLSPIVAGTDGSLHAQVLVLPNDEEGPRTLSAASMVGGAPGTPATAPFLVVAQTFQPPTSPLVRIAIKGVERPLIERR